MTRGRPQNAARSRKRLFLALGAGALVAAALVATSLVNARAESPKPAVTTASEAPAGTAEVSRLLSGIPQDGTFVGRRDAPVTLVEYADLQCPYCAQWARETLPTLIRDYVRPGKLRIEFRGLAFIGPDSDSALRTALAAAAHDRLWNVVELLYLNQGAENSGWATDELLTGILRASGLDSGAVLGARGSQAVEGLLLRANTQAQTDGVRGTPSFQLGRTGEALQPLTADTLAPPPYRAAVERLLGT